MDSIWDYLKRQKQLSQPKSTRKLWQNVRDPRHLVLSGKKTQSPQSPPVDRMLLPGGKKDKGQPEVGPGFYPLVMRHFSVPDDPEQWNVDLSPSLTHTVEAMVKLKSSRQGKKHNLMSQVIPIYGFGILLYILYIIYKLTSKTKTSKSGIYTAVKMKDMQSPATSDYELARLQQRLLRAEMMMERIISEKSHCSSRKRKFKTSTSKKEEKLLRQIRQITLLMQEGRLEGASPEMEAEEVPYGADWEGYPEETYPEFDDVRVDRRAVDNVTTGEPPSQPTAEALAERMEQEEEEIMARKLSVVQEEDEEEEDKEEENYEEEEVDDGEEEAKDEVKEVEEEEGIEEEAEEEEEQEQLLPPASPAVDRKQERLGLELSRELQLHSGGRKQISFSDHKHIFHYPKEETYEEEEEEEKEEGTEEEDEETEVEEETEEEEEGTEMEEEEEAEDDDDPLMEAESLQFNCEGSSNPEDTEGEKEEYFLTIALMEDEGQLHVDMPKDIGQSGLRMRNRRET